MGLLLTIFRLELARARRDRFLWLSLAVQALMAFVARHGAIALAGSRGVDGPAYVVFSMNLAGTLTTPLLSAIFAAGLVAGEVGRGTLRPLLAWPVSRSTVLFAKAIMASLVAFLLTLTHLAATVLIAAQMPLEAGADPDFPLRTVSQVWAELSIAVLVGLLPLLATVFFGLLISVHCNQGGTAIGVTVGLLLVAEPAKLLLPEGWDRWIFSSHFDTATAIASSRMDQIPAQWMGSELGTLAISCAAALILFFAASWFRFQRLQVAQ
jgi:Cu-processing system permease protein